MTAGRGVTHSERTSAATRAHPHSLYGIQTWVALPEDQEETAPDFEHRDKADLPSLDAEGKRIRLILGSAYGQQSPVRTSSEMFYIDVALDPGAIIPLPDEHEDRGIYVLEGGIRVAGVEYAAGRMMIFRPGDRVAVQAGPEGARLMMLGGATLNGPRYIWWNFVSSSKDKIEAAKEAWRQGDWANGMFTLPPGDNAEHAAAPD